MQQLEIEGLIRKSRGAGPAAMGRPEETLEILGGAGLLVGISIEAASARLLVTGLDGVRRTSLLRPLPEDPQRLDEALVRLFQDALLAVGPGLPPVRGLGLAIADEHPTALPLLRKGILVRELEAAARVPVFVEAAVGASALAELHFGAARGSRNFLYVHSRDVLTGALVVDGRLYHGFDRRAGSLAHFKVDPNGRRCSCGATGCLQAYVPEPALLARLAEFSHGGRSVQDLDRAARANDPLVKTVLSEAATYLGFAFSNAANLLELEEIVIAGDLAILADHLLPAIRATMRANVFGGQREIAVGRSTVGDNEAVMGAIALAMNSFLPGVIEGEGDEMMVFG